MTRPRANPRNALKRPRVIKWRASEGSTGPGVRQLSELLRELWTWPIAQFAADWWPGDYRLLKLTSQGAIDENVEVICQSSAASEFTDVTVTAWIRSKGQPRALSSAEQSTLATVGFGSGSGGRAELIHLNPSGQELELAEGILVGLSEAFGVRGAVTLRSRLETGSRLDSMPVFQDIRPHELLSLLHASGFTAQLVERSEEPGATAGPLIAVSGEVPFLIELAEPSNDVYVTLRFEARFNGVGSPAMVEALNRSWWVGAATLLEGVVVIRQQISVTGGISHAGLRDRVDEWVAGLSEARRLRQ